MARQAGAVNLRKLANPYATRVKGTSRSLMQKEQDLLFISQHYLAGESHTEIWQAINKKNDGVYTLSYAQVTRDIYTLHARWIESYLVNFDTAKARELKHIDMLEEEYRAGWERSQKKLEEIESESIKDTQGDNKPNSHYARTRVKKLEHERDGNVKFLDGIQWCIDQRCKILGLNTYTQNINVSWRKQAEQAGLDPEGVVDDLYKQFIAAATVDGGGSAGSLGEGTKDPGGA